MIQDLASRRTHAAQAFAPESSLSQSEYRAILGVFAVSLTLSLMVLIQLSMNM